jgi:hypothetical protein
MTDDELIGYLDQPFRFWACPEHPTGSVSSTGDRFRCDECGQTNHPMDLPGVDRVLVVASCDREFHDHFWGYSSEWMHFNNAHEVQFGKTKYTYASDYSHLRGYNPARTRSMILDRYQIAPPDLVQLAVMSYAPAILPEPRQAPEPVWVRTDEADWPS